MKSLQIRNVIRPVAERRRYTDLQVMKSAAGWYVGTAYIEIDGFQEPGSRDTPYFPTEQVAKEILAKLESMTENQITGGEFDIWLKVGGDDPQDVGYRFTP